MLGFIPMYMHALQDQSSGSSFYVLQDLSGDSLLCVFQDLSGGPSLLCIARSKWEFLILPFMFL